MAVVTNTKISGGGATSSESSVDNVLASPLLLKKWRAARARIINGGGTAKWLKIGDSTTVGAGAGGTGFSAGGREKNTSVKLANMLTKTVAPAFAHSIIGSGNTASFGTFDSRLSVGAGWGQPTLDNSLGKTVWFNSTTTNVLSLLPTASVDTFVIYYAIFNAGGTFNANINGGTNTVVNTFNATQSVGVATVSGTLGSNTLNITRASGIIYLLGIRAYNSASPAIEIIQAGGSGTYASEYNASVKTWDALNFISNNLQPDLTSICFGINEWKDSIPLATYEAALRAIATAAKTSGDVLFVTPPPSAVSVASLATQQTYVDTMITVAQSMGCPYVDLWRRFVSYEEANALGMYVDTLHPSGVGYAEWVLAEFNTVAG